MAQNINTSKLIESCDLIAHRCTRIADTQHGSSWLFNKLMRYFESEPSAISITIPVHINIIGDGIAIIGRDGSLILKREA